jgi:Fe-S-cluster containining protein
MHPDVFTNQKREIVEEYFLQFQKNGYCFFLSDKNGSFSCSVYEARPEICRNYPSKPIQQSACDSNRNNFLLNHDHTVIL